MAMGIVFQGRTPGGDIKPQGTLPMRKVVGMELFDTLLSVWMLLTACGLLFSATR